MHKVLPDGTIEIYPYPVSSRSKHHRQVQELYKRQNGLCHYCAEPMIRPTGRHMKYQPENLATLEHLDDRHSDERGQHGGEYRRVLACRRCNNDRGRESHLSVPIEERRRLSQQHGPKRKRRLISKSSS